MNVWKLIKSRPAAVIVGGALLVAVVLVASRPREARPQRPERAWIVNTQVVKTQTLRPTLELFGAVQSPQDAELSAGIDANVLELKVKDGESVEAGAALVELDARDVELALRQREADVLEIEAQLTLARQKVDLSRETFEKEKEVSVLAESRFNRTKELFDLNRVAESAFEQASEEFTRQQLKLSEAEFAFVESDVRVVELEAQLARAEALMEQANLNLDRATIRAPFSGVVSEIEISKGDRVRAGDRVMRIQNPDAIEVRAQIPARFARDVAEALAAGTEMPATAEIDQRTISGRLVRVSRLTRQGSGGVDAFLTFPDDAEALRLGSTVRVMLELPPVKDVIAVPAEAVYGRDRLYKLDGDRMKMVSVERLGDRALQTGGTEVIVRSPLLTEGDHVILTKLANAADGLLVQPTDTRQATVDETADPQTDKDEG